MKFISMDEEEETSHHLRVLEMDSTIVKDTTGISIRIAGYANGRVIVQ